MSEISELNGFFSEAIKGIEALDHLVGSPVEPFIDGVTLNGALTPACFTLINDLDRFLDFLHSLEKSGFTNDPFFKFPKWDENKPCKERRAAFFVKEHQGQKIYWNVSVCNDVLFEYEISERLGSLK